MDDLIIEATDANQDGIAEKVTIKARVQDPRVIALVTIVVIVLFGAKGLGYW